MKNRKKFTIVAIVNLTWFCVACLILSLLDKSIPDSLIVAWFSAWTVELGILYGIKLHSKGE